MQRDAFSAEDVLRKAHAVGQYYGFTSLSALAAASRGTATKTAYPENLVIDSLDQTAQSIASFLKQCRDNGIAPGLGKPLFLWHTNIAPGRAAPKQATVQFHAIGADRAIADAVVIRALRALTQDLFKDEPKIRINTLGDKETRARFARELGNFFKKRAATLPEDCTNCAKRDVFEAADLLIERACADDLPAPTDHLSDASRKRFEELLEYLEMTETPYELAPCLISRGATWSETCFEFKVNDRVVAWGSRYNDLARAFFKTPVTAAGAVLRIETATDKVPPAKKPSRMRFVFVHIGEEAKRTSIRLAEEFKRAHVPLAQTIGLESLSEQMLHVEKTNPPYMLIMGRKEALEGSAVLRNRETQEDLILPLLGLAEHLKDLV
ncbi:MAG TPA: His/Gly/Thr/Pro-type tRNA ligase C-terminal domain-containing protein [Candidatus Paceibacterota bacterium]|nr:His/Gly/Thr/Pro-type tRNA ligase C-terminal domain-containing protein [Candidatus Paceibacterota bacterium]